MDILLTLIPLVIFILVLDQSSNLAITNSVRVSDITGLGKSTVGFLLISFSTSIPELSVAFTASFSGDAPVSVGNVIGSNIVNVCLIVGLAPLLFHLRHPRSKGYVSLFTKENLSSLYFGLFIASIIPLSLVYLVDANWFVGVVLISVFLIYVYQLTKIRVPTEDRNGVSEEMMKRMRLYVSLTFLGVAGVVVSSYFLVKSAVAIAEFIGVPKSLIGATVIAFGTGLPELSTTVKAYLKGQQALAFGNIVGSGFMNTTLILGVTLLVPTLIGQTLTLNMLFFRELVVFSLLANMMLWYFLSAGRLGWREGAMLLFIYALFLATSLGEVSLPI